MDKDFRSETLFQNNCLNLKKHSIELKQNFSFLCCRRGSLPPFSVFLGSDVPKERSLAKSQALVFFQKKESVLKPESEHFGCEQAYRPALQRYDGNQGHLQEPVNSCNLPTPLAPWDP